MSRTGRWGQGRTLGLLAWFSLSACGSTLAPAFDPRFPDAPALGPGQAAERLQASPPDDTPALALLATTHGTQPSLVYYDVQPQRVRWRRAIAAQSRPELLGDIVLVVQDGHLLGLQASDGSTRFEVELEACGYLGAARSGDSAIYSCEPRPEPGEPPGRASLTSIDLRSGNVRWRREADGSLGKAAAKAGVLLVPWQQQWLSILDAKSGDEIARVRIHDDVVDWVRADTNPPLFGHRRLHRLEAPAQASTEAGELQLKAEALPGRPAAFESAFLAQPGTRSARGRIALHWQPEASGADAIRPAHDRYYFVFYRYAFGYDGSGQLQWASRVPRDVVAGRALGQGLLLALEDGQLVLLSPTTGAVLSRSEVGAEIAAASFAGAGAPSATAQPEPAARGLRESLTEIALDSDARLVPARSYAVAQLAALADPRATADLLRIYQQHAVPPELARAAADALRGRRVGLEHLIEAAHSRFDFLEQTRPAPLAVVVPPLIEAGDVRAVPVLFERLVDHETPAADLPVVVRGIVELGNPSVVDPLFGWLRLYRADSSFAADPEALIEAARGVLRHGGERGRALLSSLNAKDGAATAPTLPELSAALAALLPPPVQAAPATNPGATSPEPAAPPAPPQAETLTAEAVAATFAPHAAELQSCVAEELERNPELNQVRMVFIAESQGGSHALGVTPDREALVSCLDPKLASYRFPAFKGGRQVVSYTIQVRAPAVAADGDSAGGKVEPWWAFYAKRAPNAAPKRLRRPWWRSRQPLVAMVERAPAAADSEPKAVESAPPTPAPDANSDAWWVPAAGEPARTRAPSPAPAAPAAPQQPPAPASAEDAWWVPTAPAATPSKSKPAPHEGP